MDGSANPYLLQAGIIASGIDGMEQNVILANLYLLICIQKETSIQTKKTSIKPRTSFGTSQQ